MSLVTLAVESRAMESPSLFSLDSLTDLRRRSGVDMRPALLRVLTDLYVHRLLHTPEEEQHYTELALRLLEAADVPTRVAVAARLARHTSPPLRVLQYLARDLPDVAAPLRSHPLLRASNVINQMAAHSSEAATKVATPDVSDASSPLDSRTARELNETFFAASANERRLILLNLNVVAPLPASGVAISRDPSVCRRLEAAALSRNREDFARQLAPALQIPREQARRIARDHLGEPVAVVAKALGMRRDVLYRILMFINSTVGHSIERVNAVTALYEEMSAAAADGMVAIWQALQKDERGVAQHQPVTLDDTRVRARPATALRHAPTVPRTNDRRTVS